MSLLNQIRHILSRWLGTVAAFIVACCPKIVAAPSVRVVEDKDGTFTVEANGKAASGSERLRIINGEVVATPSLPSSASGGGKGGGAAAMLKASRAELVLQPERFVIRPLE